MLDASTFNHLQTAPALARDDDQRQCGSRWGVVHTHPQAEDWAQTNLRRQGFRTYLPTHIVVRHDPVTRSMTRRVHAPLFTSYLFVQLSTAHWAPIRHSFGVRRLLMSGEKPYLLPDAVLSALQAGEELRATTYQPNTSWAPGVPCSLATGAFQGLPAAVVSVEGDKARVALLLFGELRTVAVSTDSLIHRSEN